MSPARILIVEDNYDNLELIRFLVTRAGHAALEASNGVEGLEIARRDRPDLVLLDLSMPEKDGWSMAGDMKADPSLASIPVVAVTAHALPGDRKRALDAGCDDYLSKPLNFETFHAVIEKALSRSGA